MTNSLKFHMLAGIGAALALATFFMPWVTIYNINDLNNSIENQIGYKVMTDKGSIHEHKWYASVEGVNDDNDYIEGGSHYVLEAAESLWIVALGLILVLAKIFWEAIIIGLLDNYVDESLYKMYLVTGTLGFLILLWLFFINMTMIKRADIYDVSFKFGFWLALIGQAMISVAGVGYLNGKGWIGK